MPRLSARDGAAAGTATGRGRPSIRRRRTACRSGAGGTAGHRGAATPVRRRRLARVAHPLIAIRGYAELYRAGALDDPNKLGEAMRRTEDETKRMGRLIDDLLTLARLDQRQHPAFEDVDLVRLGSDAVADARAIEPDRPIEFVHPGQAVVRGDADRLRQVFSNLITNARVHTAPDTRIRVEVIAGGDRCRIVVSDGGPGVEPDQLERIFDRFYGVDKARPRGGGGSGLGLSIVAAVASAHGGEASVESSLGEGTSFTVTIPEQRPTCGTARS